MIYDDPLVTYDGTPTNAYFNQLLSAVQDNPANTVIALNSATIPVDIRKVKGISVGGSGTDIDPWGPIL
jgi:hypothetical protein